MTVPPEEPAPGVPDVCCRDRDPSDPEGFTGCRVSDRCAADEPIWLRGAIDCSAVELGRCGGGRCCANGSSI